MLSMFASKRAIADDFTNLRMYLYLNLQFRHSFSENRGLFQKAFEQDTGNNTSIASASSSSAGLNNTVVSASASVAERDVGGKPSEQPCKPHEQDKPEKRQGLQEIHQDGKSQEKNKYSKPQEKDKKGKKEKKDHNEQKDSAEAQRTLRHVLQFKPLLTSLDVFAKSLG